MKYGIANVKAKVGGGGADLNLAYGLTPPNDTSKIWVKCSEPSKVKIEANRNLVVSSNENAKVLTNTTIGGTYIATENSHYITHPMVKIGNLYYFTATATASYFNGLTNFGSKILYKAEEDGTATLVVSLDYSIYSLFKMSDTKLLAICYGSSTSYFRIVDLENQTYVKLETMSSVSAYRSSAWYDNNIVYSIGSSSGNEIIRVKDLSITGETSYSLNISTILGKTYWSSAVARPVLYNNALYFVMCLGSSPSPTSTTSTPTLVKWVVGSNTLEEITTLPYIVGGNNNYSYADYSPLLFGNKMILTNIYHSTTYSSSQKYCDFILIIDLSNGSYEKIDIGVSYVCAYPCIDDNTGNIIIWGGLGDTYNKKVLSNIYSLEENTLDLYYDTSSTLNIKLMDTPTITMDAPINHAWLGDSNDIAQPVDFFYYKNNLWWGVNCLGYTQLSNCVISASDVAIDLANATSDTQTITITPTWANETGVITTSVATSDDTLATASLSGDSLVVNALAVGTPTITISVVDEYGTTFTKSITITITNSGA